MKESIGPAYRRRLEASYCRRAERTTPCGDNGAAITRCVLRDSGMLLVATTPSDAIVGALGEADVAPVVVARHPMRQAKAQAHFLGNRLTIHES